MLGAVLPGISSHSPFFQSLTSSGWASSVGVSCRVGTNTTSFSTPRWPAVISEKRLAIPLKICQSVRDSQAGSTAAVSGWMKGCMSDVLRSFFSYQVAVGSTMSEYMHVVDMRKSSVTSRSSRSEEHTSELQSPLNLVCRLLLEKKKNHTSSSSITEFLEYLHEAHTTIPPT